DGGAGKNTAHVRLGARDLVVQTFELFLNAVELRAGSVVAALDVQSFVAAVDRALRGAITVRTLRGRSQTNTELSNSGAAHENGQYGDGKAHGLKSPSHFFISLFVN